MALRDAVETDGRDRLPNDLRLGVDEIDRRILAVLAEDARIPNNALADRVGVAPSTCLGRVRTLRERGVIRGYHADIDPAALGRPLQAMISVRLASGARGHIANFGARVARLTDVLNVAGRMTSLCTSAWPAATRSASSSWRCRLIMMSRSPRPTSSSSTSAARRD
jgi:DNA-binding Lrp family transcriptional regulator